MVLRKWGAIPRVGLVPNQWLFWLQYSRRNRFTQYQRKSLNTLQNKTTFDQCAYRPVLAEIKGELSSYYVSIGFDKNGKVWFKSGQSTKEDSARNIIKTKIAEGSARSLTLVTPQGLSGQNTSAISIDNIAETLKSVNNENRQTFDQRAWHGSGMDFNEFNLEKPLPAPGIWYMAGAFTRLKTKRRPGV